LVGKEIDRRLMSRILRPIGRPSQNESKTPLPSSNENHHAQSSREPNAISFHVIKAHLAGKCAFAGQNNSSMALDVSHVGPDRKEFLHRHFHIQEGVLEQNNFDS
jgi:hypothetical protein